MLHFASPRAVLGRAVLYGSLACFFWTAPSFAQVSPEDSARQLKPAEGLEATLWAKEPMILNPTNMDIDSRGRVWVTEGLNYRLTRNRNLPKVNEADALKILEDTDGDGKADKVTVFADRIFPVPMGLAVEERYGKDGEYQGCKVYIGNSPDILVLEDTDGDDKADKRYALLSGFGGIDSDHGVHGMALGLDGKLYFTHGDGCCTIVDGNDVGPRNFDVIDKSGRHVSSTNLANTLRCNRDGTQFEILADRQRNNYETCLNAFGNNFTSDNDDDGNRGCRVIWVMDGGHYGYRTPGSPRHWGEDVPGNVPKLVGTGNGSPCGIMAYEGSLLPAEYLGGLLEAEAGTRQINFFPLTRKGAAFRTEAKVLLASNDPWFRPVDMTAAPDGSIFVADWYDSGVGGHRFVDQTTGRIYRVAPKGKATAKVKYDFASVPGLIEALKSPVVATQDAARRSLIARGEGAVSALEQLFAHGTPIERARAFWVLYAIGGDGIAKSALKDKDARIREQAVRMLGRDCRTNGNVEYTKSSNGEQAKEQAPAALANLDVLLPLAADPDAGVRRELILALRNVPTDKAGAALTKLAAGWDGSDRWYLEALGLALEKRDKSYLAHLLDGALYGKLEPPAGGSHLALPPYFPVDRNEAYLTPNDAALPASALSKSLGLAWRVHTAEALPLLRQALRMKLDSELQQAVDDVMMQIKDPAAGELLAELVLESKDPLRKRELLAGLVRGLEGPWKGEVKRDNKVAQTIKATLDEPATRALGIQLVAATRDARYGGMLATLSQDTKAPDEVRVAAVEALGAIKAPEANHVFTHLIGAVKNQKNSSAAAEAAVRTMPRVFEAREQLLEIMGSDAYPLALRREALRTLAQTTQGASRLIALAREGKLPAALKTEATTALYTHPDRQIHQQAASVLPPPRTASGRALPPIGFLLRREGNAERGRAVFFREGSNTCGTCHRVQGQGQWVGPDLSTIGTKYGKEELLRSILNPSAAIGFSFQSLVIATGDGRVVTGLPVEQDADHVTLKTAEGKRIRLDTREIDDKKTSDVSLMPEGLAETMSDQDLVDLLAFLGTLRQPVSIVGEYHAVGPLSSRDAARLVEGKTSLDTSRPLSTAGKSLAWRRLSANAESLVDLSSLVGNDASQCILLHAPILSANDQAGRLVIDTKAPVQVWLNGQKVSLTSSNEAAPRSAEVRLPKGPSELVILLQGAPAATLVTTIVAPEPVEFAEAAGAKAAAK